jgi:hypothetical protein
MLIASVGLTNGAGTTQGLGITRAYDKKRGQTRALTHWSSFGKPIGKKPIGVTS